MVGAADGFVRYVACSQCYFQGLRQTPSANTQTHNSCLPGTPGILKQSHQLRGTEPRSIPPRICTGVSGTPCTPACRQARQCHKPLLAGIQAGEHHSCSAAHTASTRNPGMGPQPLSRPGVCDLPTNTTRTPAVCCGITMSPAVGASRMLAAHLPEADLASPTDIPQPKGLEEGQQEGGTLLHV